MDQSTSLKEARAQLRMTQQHLADAAAVSIRSVIRAEGGKPVSAEVLRALCSVLDIDVSALPREREQSSHVTEALIPETAWSYVKTKGLRGYILFCVMIVSAMVIGAWAAHTLVIRFAISQAASSATWVYMKETMSDIVATSIAMKIDEIAMAIDKPSWSPEVGVDTGSGLPVQTISRGNSKVELLFHVSRYVDQNPQGGEIELLSNGREYLSSKATANNDAVTVSFGPLIREDCETLLRRIPSTLGGRVAYAVTSGADAPEDGFEVLTGFRTVRDVGQCNSPDKQLFHVRIYRSSANRSSTEG